MPLLKAKISTEPGAAHFWDGNGVERPPPEDWRRTKMHFRVHLSHVWIMSGTYGITLNVTDAKVISEGRSPVVCPF